MASPQTEEGFTRIANEILDFIPCFSFNGSQRSIIDVIWRYTYGFRRIKHDFSLSFLKEATELSDKAVRKELLFLIESKVLTVHQEATKKTARVISFNKDYDSWLVPRRGVKKVEQMSMFDEDSERYSCTSQSGTVVPVKDDSERYSCTSKKEKELKESIKDIIYTRFNEFWTFYPKKVGKKAAEKHFERLHKEKSFSWDDFIQGTKNYVAYCQQTNRFLKDGSAYVNQETYKDFLDMPLDNNSISKAGTKNTKSQQKDDILKNAFAKAVQDEENGSNTTVQGDKRMLPEFRG